MCHPGAYAHGGIADHGMGGAVECEVLAALDREGEQEREAIPSAAGTQKSVLGELAASRPRTTAVSGRRA